MPLASDTTLIERTVERMLLERFGVLHHHRIAGQVPTEKIEDDAITTAKVGKVPAARATKSGSQSITNATTTALTFDTERYDTDDLHDTNTNNSRLTASVAGTYAMSGAVRFASNATGIRQAFLQINGDVNLVSSAALISAVSGSVTDVVVAGAWNMSASDYVELRVQQTSGGALNVLSGSGITNLEMHWVGPL